MKGSRISSHPGSHPVYGHDREEVSGCEKRRANMQPTRHLSDTGSRSCSSILQSQPHRLWKTLPHSSHNARPLVLSLSQLSVCRRSIIRVPSSLVCNYLQKTASPCRCCVYFDASNFSKNQAEHHSCPACLPGNHTSSGSSWLSAFALEP